MFIKVASKSALKMSTNLSDGKQRASLRLVPHPFYLKETLTAKQMGAIERSGGADGADAAGLAFSTM